MERTEQRLKQFEVRRRGLLLSLSEQVEKAHKLLEEMSARACELRCFPREHLVQPEHLGSRGAKVTTIRALNLGFIPGQGHTMLIPADDGTVEIVATERKGVYRKPRLRPGETSSRDRWKLEYYQFSNSFQSIEDPFLGLELRIKAAEKLGEIMQTAVELRSQREKQQGV